MKRVAIILTAVVASLLFSNSARAQATQVTLDLSMCYTSVNTSSGGYSAGLHWTIYKYIGDPYDGYTPWEFLQWEIDRKGLSHVVYPRTLGIEYSPGDYLKGHCTVDIAPGYAVGQYDILIRTQGGDVLYKNY